MENWSDGMMGIIASSGYVSDMVDIRELAEISR
jgi:hypothetical protein